jgi:hypothetical protein
MMQFVAGKLPLVRVRGEPTESIPTVDACLLSTTDLAMIRNWKHQPYDPLMNS